MKKSAKSFQLCWDVNIDTDLELILPDDYVNSTEERLLLYQKLADVRNAAELSHFEYRS